VIGEPLASHHRVEADMSLNHGLTLAALTITTALAAACGGAETTDRTSHDLTEAPAPACAAEDCGPMPLGAHFLCEDGSEGGVTGRCLPQGKTCAWEYRECPPPPTDDPCDGVSLPACPAECDAFPMTGACTPGEECRLAGSKIGDECRCSADGTWTCSPHPPLGMGCNRVCE
jgi:hypothetical protein